MDTKKSINLLLFFLISFIPIKSSNCQVFFETTKHDTSKIILHSFFLTNSFNLLQDDSKTSINSAILKNSNKKYKQSFVPMFVFGLVGTVIGGYIGSKFDPTYSLPGEFPELMTNGIAIGMCVGAICGGTIGYFLGKEKIK